MVIYYINLCSITSLRGVTMVENIIDCVYINKLCAKYGIAKVATMLGISERQVYSLKDGTRKIQKPMQILIRSLFHDVGNGLITYHFTPYQLSIIKNCIYVRATWLIQDNDTGQYDGKIKELDDMLKSLG